MELSTLLSESRSTAAPRGPVLAGRDVGADRPRQYRADGDEPREAHPRSAYLRDALLGPDWVGPATTEPGADGELADPAAGVRPGEVAEVTWRREAPVSDALALEELSPGKDLLGRLLGLDVGEVSQAVLLAAMTGFERMRRALDAAQMAVIAEADRRCFLGDVPTESLTAEMAVRLGVSQRHAEDRLAEAFDLVQGHPIVWRAMAGGQIDRYKAVIIAQFAEQVASRLDDEGFAEFQLTLVELGTRVAPGALKRHARAMVGRMTPPMEEEATHEKAREKRHVWYQELEDGMAEIGARLPAADALAAKLVLDRAAAKTSAEDKRTVDQRRADTFAAIFRTMLDAGATPLGALPVAQGSRPHLMLTIEAEATRAREPERRDARIVLEGYGPISAMAAQRAAGGAAGAAGFKQAEISLLVKDPWNGEYRTVLDAPANLDPDAVLAAVRKGRDPLASFPRAGPDPPSTQIGSRIDAKAVRLAAERLVSSDTYRPSAEVLRRVLLRDSRCTFPSCAMPAWRCEVDHIVPFDASLPADEQTREDNLQVVCHRHHELKTHHGWSVTRDAATGIVTWHSPTGAAFLARAEYLEPLCC